MSKVLENHGFNPSTAINLVSNCRDELCRPFTEYLDTKWAKPSFNIASLAGMVFCGRTGFKAAMAHAPVVDGKERYVFWVAPHIAFSGDNEVGKVWRPGREKASTACGALLAVLSEIKAGRINVQLDPGDIEMSLLKQHILSYLKYGHEPTLIELTYAVHECILDEVRNTAKAAVDLELAEYVIISGIQVHGGFSKTVFWPGSILKYTNKGPPIDLYEEYAASVSDWTNSGMDEWVMAEELAAIQSKERSCRLAASTGDVEALTKFGDGGDIPLSKVLDHKKQTLLHVATIHGQVEVARFLLQRWSKCDKHGRTMTKIIEARDTDHMTAMECAARDSNDLVADLLMEFGAGLDGDFLQDQLVKAVKDSSLEQLQRLMWYAKDIGQAIQSRDRDGRSLVALAAQSKIGEDRRMLLQVLLSFGAQVDEVDFYGNSSVISQIDAELINIIDSPRKQSVGTKSIDDFELNARSTSKLVSSMSLEEKTKLKQDVLGGLRREFSETLGALPGGDAAQKVRRALKSKEWRSVSMDNVLDLTPAAMNLGIE